MNNIIRKVVVKPIILIFCSLATSAFTSCDHKELELEPGTRGKFNVVFDWKNAPDANPESMVLYLYDINGGDPYRFVFSNNTGGTIRVPYSLYNAICLNADLTDWAVISRSRNIEGYEVLTTDAEQLASTGFTTRLLPRAAAAEQERYANTPGMLWGSRLDNIESPHDEQDKTFVMYPDEKVCHYSVDVYDTGDVSIFSTGGIDATLSGMSEGYLIGSDSPHQSKVTHPFLLKPVAADNKLHAEFLTFGEPSTHPDHNLSIYLVTSDGKKWNCNIDVTDQIRNAKDPRHVNIIVRGVNIPTPATGSGMAVVPDVEEWETVNITLKM